MSYSRWGKTEGQAMDQSPDISAAEHNPESQTQNPKSKWLRYIVPSNFYFLAWLLLSIGLALIPAYIFFRVQLTVPADQALANGNDLLGKRTVLAIVAHPDDLEWYIGGTLRRLADNGANVQVVVASYGEKSPNNHVNAPDLAAARKQEQLNAAKINRYSGVRFLGLSDRGVAADANLPHKIQELIDEFKPEAIFAFDPEYPSLPYLHPDHQGSGRLVLKEWRKRSIRPPIYLFQSRRPNTAVDITLVIDIKAEAFEQHLSQNGGDSQGMIKFHAGRGKEVGVEYAELFRRLQ
jgi:LmbE family N-acetylglucosaminyl deacetylase